MCTPFAPDAVSRCPYPLTARRRCAVVQWREGRLHERNVLLSSAPGEAATPGSPPPRAMLLDQPRRAGDASCLLQVVEEPGTPCASGMAARTATSAASASAIPHPPASPPRNSTTHGGDTAGCLQAFSVERL